MTSIYNLAFVFFFTLFQPGLFAQVVHAGLWTGYLDGIGIGGIVVRDSLIYVTTQNGTARVDPETGQYRYFRDMGNPALPAYVSLRPAAIDPAGRLWVVHDQQLLGIDPDGTISATAPFPQFPPFVLQTDRNGQLWAGLITYSADPATPYALARLSGGAWEYVDVGVENLNVWDIAFDGQNRPWFSVSGRIYRFNGSTFEVVTDNGVPVIGQMRLAISNDGRVATAGGYNTSTLRYFDKQSWKTVYTPGFSFPVFDENNVLWVSDRYGNVYRMDENDSAPQQVLTTAKNYRTGETEYLGGLGLDQDGRLWLGKSTGLFTAPDKTVDQWDFVPLSSLLSPGSIAAVAASGDTAWVVNPAGITRLFQENFEKLNTPAQGLTAAFYDENRKGLWVSSAGKLGFLQGGQYTELDLNPILLHTAQYNTVYQMEGDPAGNLWLRTRYALVRYSPSGQWKQFLTGDELPDSPNGIGSFYLKDNAVWLTILGFSVPGYSTANKLFKIIGDAVNAVSLGANAPEHYSSYAVVSDSVFWFETGLNIALYDHGIVSWFQPGTLNSEELYAYSPGTLLVFSNFGLYVYRFGEWFKPEIPSDRISNTNALPWFLLPSGKLYMGNLLVLENLDQLLNNLTPAAPPPDLPTLHVYPNPVHDFLYLDPEFAAKCPDCRADLFSADGALIQSIVAPLPASVDVQNLPVGVYVLQVYAGRRPLRSIKLVRH